MTGCICHAFGRNVCLLNSRVLGLSENIPWCSRFAPGRGAHCASVIGLANTLLDDQHARRISGALRSLVDLAPGHEPETLELHRMVFQAATRRELLTEARRADVNLLLSDPNGPALRGF